MFKLSAQNAPILKKDEKNKLIYLPLIAQWEQSKKYKEITQDIDNLVVHPASRVMDTLPITKEWKDGLDEFRKTRGFQRVNPLTLYQLNSGPNKGKYLGANVFSLNKQKYLVCEAPYSTEDYFRSVIDNDMRVLISLARPKHDDISYREGYPLDLHYLNCQQSITVDNYQIACTQEKQIKLLKDDYAVLKELTVSNGKESYKLYHIIYEEWVEIGGSKSAVCLVNLMNVLVKCLHHVSPQDPYSVGIASNCKYGFGRSSTVVALLEIYKGLSDIIVQSKNLDPLSVKITDHPDIISKVQIDELSYIATLANNIMAGAAEVHLPQITAYVNEIRNQASKHLETERNFNYSAHIKQTESSININLPY